MPLDPNISLGLQPMPQLDLTRIQQLRNLMGQEQLMGQQFLQSQLQQQLTQAQIPLVQTQLETAQAQLPGVRAQAETAQTQAQSAKRLEAGRQELPKVITEMISAPGSKGVIDHDRVVYELNRRGHPEAAFEYMTNRNQTEAGRLANINDVRDSVDKNQLRMASILRNIPDLKQRQDAANKMIDVINKQYAGTGLKVGDMVASGLYSTDPKTGQTRLDPTKINATYAQTITYENQQRLNEYMDSVFFTKEAMDKDSPLSNNARALAADLSKGAFIPGPNMSARDIYRDPNLRQYVPASALAQLMPQGARVQYANEAMTANLEIGNYDSALRAVGQLPPDLIKLKPGIDAQRMAQRLGVSPVLSQIDTAVAEHNAKYPKDEISSNLSYEQQQAKLTEARARAQRSFNEANKKSKMSLLPYEDQKAPPATEEKPSGRRSDFGTEATLSRRVLQEFQNLQPEGSRMEVNAYIEQLKKQFPKTKFTIVD